MQEKTSCPLLGGWAESATQLALVPLIPRTPTWDPERGAANETELELKGQFPLKPPRFDTSLGSSPTGLGWWERGLAPWEGVAFQLSVDAWAVWVRTGQWQLSGALVALAINFFPGESPEQGWKEITARELLKETSHLHTGQADQYPSIKFLSLGSQNKSLFGNRIITDIRCGDARVNP